MDSGGMIYGGFLRCCCPSCHLPHQLSSNLGTQPYSTATRPVIHRFSLLYLWRRVHNFHHTFQADYRNGHKWYHWDPSKWWIKVASWFGMTRDLHKIPKKSIESQKMKTAFEQSSSGEDVPSDVQAKLTQCVQQLRRGFTDLMRRREEYKLAKMERKEESKEAWKQRKEAHKARIRACKEQIAQARLEFKQLMQSIKFSQPIASV